MIIAPAPEPSVLFSIPFASAMADADSAWLAESLDLAMHMHPKVRDSPASPGVARLGLDAELRLLRGPTAHEWVLEGRTWGHPSAEAVHGSQVLVAAAAEQLDPTVSVPPRSARTPDEGVTRPLGRAASKPLARLARRLMRLR